MLVSGVQKSDIYIFVLQILLCYRLRKYSVYVYMLAQLLQLRLWVTLWTVAHQALSVGFSRQEYWSELPCPPPGDLSDPVIEPKTLCLLCWQAGSLSLAPHGKLHLIRRSEENSFVDSAELTLGLLSVFSYSSE